VVTRPTQSIACSLLESPDPSSLTDAAAALPMLPLVALEVPIKDIATRLIGILA
jgi:hypothetical protein